MHRRKLFQTKRDEHEFAKRLWAAYLKEAFRGSIEQIQKQFHVDDKTARYWLAGTHVPGGVPVVKSIRTDPEFADFVRNFKEAA